MSVSHFRSGLQNLMELTMGHDLTSDQIVDLCDLPQKRNQDHRKLEANTMTEAVCRKNSLVISVDNDD